MFGMQNIYVGLPTPQPKHPARSDQLRSVPLLHIRHGGDRYVVWEISDMVIGM